MLAQLHGHLPPTLENHTVLVSRPVHLRLSLAHSSNDLQQTVLGISANLREHELIGLGSKVLVFHVFSITDLSFLLL